MKFISVNPFTHKVEGTYPLISDAELEQQLSATCIAQKVWKKNCVSDKKILVLKLVELLRSQKNELAKTAVIEMGKPIAQAEAEIEKCAVLCEYYAENFEEYLKTEERKSSAVKSLVVYEPLGVVFGVMPWNFPYWQVIRFIVPTLLAGNTVLVKHAPNVGGCAVAIQQLLDDAGFPEHVAKMVFIDHKQSSRLIDSTEIAGISATASERTGRAIGEQAGRALKKVVLELGGSDPFIVLKDADVKSAARVAADSRLLNNGQTCISAKRFIIEKDIYDVFVQEFVKHVENAVAGDPLKPETTVGPLARRDLCDVLRSQVGESLAGGAVLLSGSNKREENQCMFTPIVLGNINKRMPVWNQETFGPVAAMISAENEYEALELANDCSYGLGASLWTDDIDKALELSSEIETGTVAINGMVVSDPRLPFGGVKASGIGREIGIEGIREFCNIKTIRVG